MLHKALVVHTRQRIVPHGELLKGHRTHLVAIPGRIRMLESVVLQRNYHFLLVEADAAKRQRGIAIFLGIGLLIADSVVQHESEVVLSLGHLHDSAVGHRERRISLVSGMVVHHHVVHHSAGIVPVLDPENIPVDTVIERADGNLDFRLGAAQVGPHRIDLVDGIRHQTVADEECADTDQHAHENERYEHPRKRNAGRLYGRKFKILAHLAQRHHRRQQGGQRDGQGQHLAASPHKELQDNLELQSLTHQLVDV